MFLTRDSVTVVFSDTRVLIVGCRALKVDVYIVSAHAPYCKSKNDCSEVCDWWKMLLSIISSRCIKGIPVLIGIDANYVVHADASPGVGNASLGGVPPPQHNSVCDLLNDLGFFNFKFL